MTHDDLTEVTPHGGGCTALGSRVQCHYLGPTMCCPRTGEQLACTNSTNQHTSVCVYLTPQALLEHIKLRLTQ